MTHPATTVCPAHAGEVAIDHHSAYYRDHVHELMAELRSACPIARSSAYGGFWIFTDYATVQAAANDDDLFASTPGVAIPPAPMPVPILPVESDPPLTQKLRALVLPQLSPRAVEKLEPQMRQIATEQIDTFIERGRCDIIRELTTPLPARLILRMLGFDESRWPVWVDAVHTLVHARAQQPQVAAQAGGVLVDELTRERTLRQGRPADADLYSAIVHGIVDGEPLDELQSIVYGLVMVIGGLDTTSGLTGNTLLQLLHDDGLRRRLVEDRSLLPAATEEFLRHDSPTLGLARTVSRDAEFFGHQLREGDRALLMWTAANRDPAMFDDPDTIDIDRAERRHMAFGVGAHRCLGSTLARRMFGVMIDEILTRLPDFRLAGEPELFEEAGELRAVRRLPIAFTPGRPSGSSGAPSPGPTATS
ncbi:cytochrome P450 [Frankia sp. QA3]|uniref:cytochrome P450 n=1 Tax=Frankia sp. QA3 TaxID=710111 RepID=UPI000269C050|nr:cytochrome P450 [Frankia sp. QA3]EIV92005.1 cytochrome P450 [Frankia sp. QA3]